LDLDLAVSENHFKKKFLYLKSNQNGHEEAIYMFYPWNNCLVEVADTLTCLTRV
jgi:hypothetical protein